MNARKRRLDSFGTESRRPQGFNAGYSWFVRVTKVTLPLIALVIVGIVAARLAQDPQQQRIADLPREDKTAPGQIDLVEAKYEGVDTKGRAYTLSAAHASRDMQAAETVLLTDPKADITLQDGGWIAVQAQQGRYDHKASTLDLSGNVAVFHDGGYELHLEDLHINIAAHEMHAAAPVKGHGPIGMLTAKGGLVVANQGDKITFNGPATLTLYHLGRAKPAEKKG